MSVKFNPEVSRAVYNNRRRTQGCVVNVPTTSLVDEEEIASRRSEFQEVNRVQKRALHEHHLSRKRCRLRMRQDIFDAFWTVYEQEAWNRLNELNGSPEVTVNHVESFGLEAILSVNKNDIIKLWRENLMMMIPTVEQHEMVPFNDRWVSNQFKDEINVNEMQRRLYTRVDNSNHWLSELVNDMVDIPSTREFNHESLSEALDDLESLHPEVFEDLQSSVESTDSLDTPPTPEFSYDRITEAVNELDLVNEEDSQFTMESAASVHEPESCEAGEEESDNKLIEAMEDWEEKQIESVFQTWDYSFLLDDVSKIIPSFILIKILKPDFILYVKKVIISASRGTGI